MSRRRMWAAVRRLACHLRGHARIHHYAMSGYSHDSCRRCEADLCGPVAS